MGQDFTFFGWVGNAFKGNINVCYRELQYTSFQGINRLLFLCWQDLKLSMSVHLWDKVLLLFYTGMKFFQKVNACSEE